MKITVISGSPKGKNSVTYHYILYLQKHFPEVEFNIFHVGQQIKAIEKKPELFDSIMAAIRDCDLVLWIYPVYTSLVPYQLVKFIDRGPAAFAKQTQKDVLGAHIVVVQRPSLFDRVFDHLLGSWGLRQFAHRDHVRATLDELFHLQTQLLYIHVEVFQHGRADTTAFFDQTE